MCAFAVAQSFACCSTSSLLQPEVGACCSFHVGFGDYSYDAPCQFPWVVAMYCCFCLAPFAQTLRASIICIIICSDTLWCHHPFHAAAASRLFDELIKELLQQLAVLINASVGNASGLHHASFLYLPYTVAFGAFQQLGLLAGLALSLLSFAAVELLLFLLLPATRTLVYLLCFLTG